MDDGRRHGRASEQSLAVASRCVDDAMVVSLSGELDMLTAPQLLPAIDQRLAEDDCALLVLDLTEVSFLSSYGLTALLDLREFAQTGDLPLLLVAGENRHVRRPFEITDLEEVLPLYESVAEALNKAGGDVE